MKDIEKLTEQEILALSDEDISLMIKLKKAQEGVKLIERPIKPEYFNIDSPDRTVYKCELFGDNLCFESIEELNSVIDTVEAASTKCSVTYDYNRAGSDFVFMTPDLKKVGYSGAHWGAVGTKKVYSTEKYNELASMMRQNKTLKEDYEKQKNDYDVIVSESKWIESDIYDKVNIVRDKYWQLDNYCRQFKKDYLPLAENDEVIAMKFLEKAYPIDKEQKEYILLNYKTLDNA